MYQAKIFLKFIIIIIGISGIMPGMSSALTSESTPYVNGILFDYYEGEWVKLPDFDQEKIIMSGIVAGFDIGVRQQDDAFGIRFIGYIKISSSGVYTFYTSSDDGSRLYINNSLIVDNDGLHTARERSGNVNLAAGFHLIQVHYFNQKGKEELEVKYKGPDLKKQVIPNSMLFHEPAPGLPLPWQNADIGRVAASGIAYVSNGLFTIKGSGADIWLTKDEFHYLYWQLSGDGEAIAKVISLANTNSWAKAGVMMRESLNDDAKHALMCVTPTQGTTFQRRIATAGNSYHSGSTGAAPLWLKLVRAGDTFSGYKSADSLNWVQVGSEKINMSANIYVGLAVTSHIDGTICTCQASFHLSGAFGEIMLQPTHATLPADGKSVATISSQPILDFNSRTVPPGTLIAVETDLGTIISGDANETEPGIQVKTDPAGTIVFDLQAGYEPGVAAVTARSVYGTAQGNTSLEFLGDDLKLITTESKYDVITQGQTNIPVSLTVKNNGLIISRIKEASLIMSGVSAVSDRQDYVIVRVDTISHILPGATAIFQFLVEAQPDAETVITTIDGQVITE
ncbi:PA14 domain-containing protein, partial [candidate division KSB1 bacterium]|nr:PA14 domain-containing protein [candidate division KSB1 bacterium]